MVTGRVHHTRRSYSLFMVPATHCHLCPTRYSFPPESSEAHEGKVSCWKNVAMSRGEQHERSLKIMHQAKFEIPRQAATMVKRHTLTIAPRPYLCLCLVGRSDASVLWVTLPAFVKIQRAADLYRLYIQNFNTYSAGIDLKRQNHHWKSKIFIMAVDP